jgi:serine/threonine-protein kinase RsbW
MKTSTLKIQSRTEHLSRVRDFIATNAREFGFDEESVNKIALAVDEACTNIIKHSYRFAPDKEIEISVRLHPDEFEIVITDRGTSFDPKTVEVPDMKEYLSKYKKGGLGMYLMRSLMDKVEYRIIPGKRNEVRLVKTLPLRMEQ